MADEYIAEPGVIPWRGGQVAGITFKCQVLLSGVDGGPEALRFRFDPCPSVFAHMHLTSQFQLLLDGRMDFPKSTMKFRSIAVHYTDHNFPYGPFAVADSHDMLVLHPKQGGLISMADRDARRQINLKGRHLYGAAGDTEWTLIPEFAGMRCKQLIPPGSGPYALMLECPPLSLLNLPDRALRPLRSRAERVRINRWSQVDSARLSLCTQRQRSNSHRNWFRWRNFNALGI